MTAKFVNYTLPCHAHIEQIILGGGSNFFYLVVEVFRFFLFGW